MNEVATMKQTDLLIRGMKELSSNWQNMYDYYKHMTTLGLGAILFISAFIKIDKAHSLQEIMIGLSIVAFLASILSALEVMSIMGNMMIFFSSYRALTNLIDADAGGYDEKRLAELNAKIAELGDKVEEQRVPIKRWTRATDYLFLAGVVFASIFVLVPTFNKLMIAVGISK
jgi:hypothetical protein